MQLPSYPWRFAHLAALWGYGVSQPVFSMLKGNPEFLVINGASRVEAITFALVLAFGPPLSAVALEFVVALVSSKVAGLVHVLAVWLFGFTALLQVLALFDPSSRAAILAPAVAAYAGAIAYARWRPIRSFLSVSFVLPIASLAVFVATAPLAAADAEAAPVAVRAETPVVFVVFDEFPVSSLMRSDGSIDAERYPGFGRLAREGTWYSRATTLHENTTFAVPTILTGSAPRGDALPTVADHPHNLFTMLGGSYAFRVREPVTRLCPVRYCPEHRSSLPLSRRVSGLLHDVGINYLHGTLPRDLRGNISPLREGWGALVENTGAGGQEFVRTFVPSNPDRTLYFLHLLQPHVPWNLLPSGRRYNDGSVIAGITDDWEPGKYERWRARERWLVDEGIQRHLLQVGYVDRFVRDLLERLDETGIYDRALIVMTADHGVSFRPGGWRRHATARNIADIAAVPLFVKYPNQRHGQEDRRAATTLDVLPTVADVLGIDLPWKLDGRSLRARPVVRNVHVGRRDDPAVVTEPEVVASDVRRVARRNAALFGNGADSLYRLGSRPALLGRPVAGLRRSVAQGARVTIARDAELGSVRKASGYVPTHVLGRISWRSLRPTDDLAVTVNGRVAAVTSPFTSGADTLFSTMVDENALRDGKNSVDVYAIRGAGRATRLLLLGGTQAGRERARTEASATD
jgi:Sulfatase